MCGINAVGAQGCSCMSTFCHAPLKIALLLHKMANGPYSLSETVCKIRLILARTSFNRSEHTVKYQFQISLEEHVSTPLLWADVTLTNHNKEKDGIF